MAHLQDVLEHAYDVLGLGQAAGGDEVFRQLVLTRIIEPTSKLDSLQVLDEAGPPPPYATAAAAARVCEGLLGGRSSWRPHARLTPG